MQTLSSTSPQSPRSIFTAILVVITAFVATGCVSKSRLEECQQEKAQLEEKVTGWEARFDAEAQRWESMQASISETVPQAINAFHSERDRIIELVPAQVQAEVETYLDGYFDTVMKGVRMLGEDNQAIRGQLELANHKLETLGTDTNEIKSMSNALDQRLESERLQRSQVAAQVTRIFDQLTEFDNTIINCAKCPERLRLNRKERETITAFHQRMLTELSTLQSQMQ